MECRLRLAEKGLSFNIVRGKTMTEKKTVKLILWLLLIIDVLLFIQGALWKDHICFFIASILLAILFISALAFTFRRAKLIQKEKADKENEKRMAYHARIEERRKGMEQYREKWLEKQRLTEESKRKRLEVPKGFSSYSNIREDHEQILLCLHGFGGDKESSVIAALRDELDKKGIGVAAFDWPAHGKSMAKDEEFRVEECLSYLDHAVAALEEKWKGKALNAFATSFGGYITMLYLDRNPSAFSRVILRSPAIRMDKVFRNLLSDEEFNKLKSGEKLTLGYERPMQIAYDFYEDLKKTDSLKKRAIPGIS